MSALLAGDGAGLAALGLVLLVVAWIARRSLRGRRERQCGYPVMDERIRARLEATIWPD